MVSLLAKRGLLHFIRWIPSLLRSLWFSGEQVGASIPHGRDYPTATTHHLTLLLLHNLVSASSDSSLDILPSPSSSTGALSLFYSCKSASGGETLLLLPELKIFQSDIQMESPSLMPVCTDSTCLSFTRRRKGNSDTFLNSLQKCKSMELSQRRQEPKTC